jgi:NADH dehydrogenase (ubiquinone) 1 beta subcomplex subunit 8
MRHASSSAAAVTVPPTEQSPQVVPTQDEMAEDPQLAGLGYPQIPQVSRQLRAAHLKWWDPQER